MIKQTTPGATYVREDSLTYVITNDGDVHKTDKSQPIENGDLFYNSRDGRIEEMTPTTVILMPEHCEKIVASSDIDLRLPAVQESELTNDMKIDRAIRQELNNVHSATRGREFDLGFITGGLAILESEIPSLVEEPSDPVYQFNKKKLSLCDLENVLKSYQIACSEKPADAIQWFYQNAQTLVPHLKKS